MRGKYSRGCKVAPAGPCERIALNLKIPVDVAYDDPDAYSEEPGYYRDFVGSLRELGLASEGYFLVNSDVAFYQKIVIFNNMNDSLRGAGVWPHFSTTTPCNAAKDVRAYIRSTEPRKDVVLLFCGQVRRLEKGKSRWMGHTWAVRVHLNSKNVFEILVQDSVLDTAVPSMVNKFGSTLGHNNWKPTVHCIPEWANTNFDMMCLHYSYYFIARWLDGKSLESQ